MQTLSEDTTFYLSTADNYVALIIGHSGRRLPAEASGALRIHRQGV